MSETAAEAREVMVRESNRLEVLSVLCDIADHLDTFKEPEAVNLWVAVDRLITALEAGEVNRPDLLLCLNECAEWLEPRSDVNDGDEYPHNHPRPNREMSLLSQLEPCIADVEKNRV